MYVHVYKKLFSIDYLQHSIASSSLLYLIIKWIVDSILGQHFTGKYAPKTIDHLVILQKECSIAESFLLLLFSLDMERIHTDIHMCMASRLASV